MIEVNAEDHLYQLPLPPTTCFDHGSWKDPCPVSTIPFPPTHFLPSEHGLHTFGLQSHSGFKSGDQIMTFPSYTYPYISPTQRCYDPLDSYPCNQTPSTHSLPQPSMYRAPRVAESSRQVSNHHHTHPISLDLSILTANRVLNPTTESGPTPQPHYASQHITQVPRPSQSTPSLSERSSLSSMAASITSSSKAKAEYVSNWQWGFEDMTDPILQQQPSIKRAKTCQGQNRTISVCEEGQESAATYKAVRRKRSLFGAVFPLRLRM